MQHMLGYNPWILASLCDLYCSNMHNTCPGLPMA